MSEAERIEIPEETKDTDTPQELGPETPADNPSAEVELTGGLADDAAPDGTGDGAADSPAHALSGETLDALSRTDPQSLEAAEAERTKWERRREMVRDRVQSWCRQYMADGGFKLGIALVTAVIAASIIVIAGIFSERQLGVVFGRAIVGFLASGIFMGAALYWLDHVGIPLFIARHEDQIQMEWVSEAEESEEAPSEPEGSQAGDESEARPEGELEELLPQEGEIPPESGGTDGEVPAAEDGEAAPGVPAPEETPVPGEETAAADSAAAIDMGGLENAVLDDAFSSGESDAEASEGPEEPEEPPSFSPMTADKLETVSVPET